MFPGDALVMWMLALEYFHVLFPLKVRSHLSESELPHATEKNGNKYLRTCSTHGRNEKCKRRFYVKNFNCRWERNVKRYVWTRKTWQCGMDPCILKRSFMAASGEHVTKKTEFHKLTGSFDQHQSYHFLKKPCVYHLHNVSRFRIEL